MLAQLADDQLHGSAIAIKAAVSMDHEHVIGVIGIAGPIDHGLERRAAIIGRGQARLNILVDDGPPFALAIGGIELPLRREADIVSGLPACRHTQIEGKLGIAGLFVG